MIPDRLVTIITATLNAEAKLPVLIDSIRNQSNKCFDWIIADGGSIDETLSIIASNLDIITNVLRGPDFGIYDGLNKAISVIKTPYYLVVGSDDVLSPEAIDRYTKAALDTDADIISANVQTNAGTLFPGRGSPWRFGHLAYISQHAVGSLIKVSLHKVIGQYSKYYPIAADRLFLLSAIERHKCSLVSVDFVAGTYSLEGLSTSRYYDTLLDIFKVDYLISENRVRTVMITLIKYIINIPRFLRR